MPDLKNEHAALLDALLSIQESALDIMRRCQDAREQVLREVGVRKEPEDHPDTPGIP